MNTCELFFFFLRRVSVHISFNSLNETCWNYRQEHDGHPSPCTRLTGESSPRTCAALQVTGSLQPRHLGSSPFSFPVPCSTQGLPYRPRPVKVSQSIFPLRIRGTLTALRSPLLGRTHLLTAFPVSNASPGTSQRRRRSHHFHPPGACLGGMGLGRSPSGKRLSSRGSRED